MVSPYSLWITGTGAYPSVCSVYKYHFMLFTLDDNEIKKIQSKCIGGELLCGECKKDLIQKINKFLSEHQKQREKAKDVLEDYLLKEKVDLKYLINEKKRKWNY